MNSWPRRSSPFIRWTDLPSRKAAFSLGSSASHATTWASAPARSASTMTLPGSGINILRRFGSLKSRASKSGGPPADTWGFVGVLNNVASDDGGEKELSDPVFMGDIVGLVASIIQQDY